MKEVRVLINSNSPLLARENWTKRSAPNLDPPLLQHDTLGCNSKSPFSYGLDFNGEYLFFLFYKKKKRDGKNINTRFLREIANATISPASFSWAGPPGVDGDVCVPAEVHGHVDPVVQLRVVQVFRRSVPWLERAAKYICGNRECLQNLMLKLRLTSRPYFSLIYSLQIRQSNGYAAQKWRSAD